MHSKSSIRGIAITTGTAVAGVAVATGLNVTGAVSTPSDGWVSVAKVSPVASLVGDVRLTKTRPVLQNYQATKTARRARRIHVERAAKAASAARPARAAASRSSTRTYAGDPRSIARSMMASRYGWNAGQFSCLDSLWNRESGWNPHAANPSGAYGIPQALPGSKMSTAGADWQDNPATQIAWGLSYVKSTYGTPCGAWSGFQSKGWY